MKVFLEKELGEVDLEKQVGTYDSFEDCTRGTNDIGEFLFDFDRAYKKAEAASEIVIPASVRAFMVLKRANIDRTQTMLVLSKLDKSDEVNMFENMCKELKIVLGSGSGTNKSDINAAIKVEQSNLPSEEVLYAAGYYRREGKNQLIKKDIRCNAEVFTHLYKLILNTDGSFEVLIDNEAKKPADWVDNAKMDDPEDSKPEDWEKPEHIADPNAIKPKDWDDEMDGEWEPPMIDNSEYKGEWKPRQIDNPDYKGAWGHLEIDNNRDYNPADAEGIAKHEENCKIGFDLWQVKSGTIFDNLIITDDPAVVKKAGERVSKEAERKMKDEHDEEESDEEVSHVEEEKYYEEDDLKDEEEYEEKVGEEAEEDTGGVCFSIAGQ